MGVFKRRMVSLRIAVDNSPCTHKEYRAHKKKPNDDSLSRCIAHYNRIDNKVLFIEPDNLLINGAYLITSVSGERIAKIKNIDYYAIKF